MLAVRQPNLQQLPPKGGRAKQVPAQVIATASSYVALSGDVGFTVLRLLRLQTCVQRLPVSRVTQPAQHEPNKGEGAHLQYERLRPGARRGAYRSESVPGE